MLVDMTSNILSSEINHPVLKLICYDFGGNEILY